jgi:hypothetical protein
MFIDWLVRLFGGERRRRRDFQDAILKLVSQMNLDIGILEKELGELRKRLDAADAKDE